MNFFSILSQLFALYICVGRGIEIASLVRVRLEISNSNNIYQPWENNPKIIQTRVENGNPVYLLTDGGVTVVPSFLATGFPTLHGPNLVVETNFDNYVLYCTFLNANDAQDFLLIHQRYITRAKWDYRVHVSRYSAGEMEYMDEMGLIEEPLEEAGNNIITRARFVLKSTPALMSDARPQIIFTSSSCGIYHEASTSNKNVIALVDTKIMNAPYYYMIQFRKGNWSKEFMKSYSEAFNPLLYHNIPNGLIDMVRDDQYKISNSNF